MTGLAACYHHECIYICTELIQRADRATGLGLVRYAGTLHACYAKLLD